ncbi:hypothetical protein BO70DRAFT_122040 [Aspergillus heteromorphus CBS 117.55]|uniref:Uncharacterized protein n=1 Tax=Aspergillus heteromorphus CBS 117.55 TaxID=1448321 RepID=A0A317VIS4_9EURO|nr:uncharacterized protein BO70DRAFT_122040 [Aspergillus heteromorphus CBS 117.55]PWY71730.1 hypothetical protein BO70DRAFT_122040 [Aspergillus heteromorphus CBS 117.55]
MSGGPKIAPPQRRSLCQHPPRRGNNDSPARDPVPRSTSSSAHSRPHIFIVCPASSHPHPHPHSCPPNSLPTIPSILTPCA